MIYYKYIRSLISICSINAKSMIDVGSAGIDLLSHCSNVPEKYSIDLNYPLSKEGIISIKEDFLKLELIKNSISYVVFKYWSIFKRWKSFVKN